MDRLSPCSDARGTVDIFSCSDMYVLWFISGCNAWIRPLGLLWWCGFLTPQAVLVVSSHMGESEGASSHLSGCLWQVAPRQQKFAYCPVLLAHEFPKRNKIAHVPRSGKHTKGICFLSITDF